MHSVYDMCRGCYVCVCLIQLVTMCPLLCDIIFLVLSKYFWLQYFLVISRPNDMLQIFYFDINLKNLMIDEVINQKPSSLL